MPPPRLLKASFPAPGGPPQSQTCGRSSWLAARGTQKGPSLLEFSTAILKFFSVEQGSDIVILHVGSMHPVHVFGSVSVSAVSPDFPRDCRWGVAHLALEMGKKKGEGRAGFWPLHAQPCPERWRQPQVPVFLTLRGWPLRGPWVAFSVHCVTWQRHWLSHPLVRDTDVSKCHRRSTLCLFWPSSIFRGSLYKAEENRNCCLLLLPWHEMLT